MPVRAWPMTSVPSSAIGRVSAWIGKGAVMPASASAVTIGALTPKEAKSGVGMALRICFGGFDERDVS